MVKFAKQLELSLVPEWKDAYCNYKALKRDAKKVREERLRRSRNGSAVSIARSGTLTRTATRTMKHISSFKHDVGSQMKHAGASGRMSLGRGGVQGLRPDDFLVV
jgi:SPX domain protein involved in polyphosphate accumulation